MSRAAYIHIRRPGFDLTLRRRVSQQAPPNDHQSTTIAEPEEER